jgi:hypothetical protein
MNYKILAKETYKKFANINGNDHIASEYAIITILKIFKDFKVQSVLEVGLGIGSISDSILNYARINNQKIIYSGTEANDFCLNALKINVDNYDLINLFDNISDLDSNQKFDFIIVDGSDKSLKEIFKFCNSKTIIYVEGYRGSQVESLKEIFPNFKHVEIISNYKNPSYGPFSSEIWCGGGQLIFINPSFGDKIYWFNEKVKTFSLNQ